MVPLLLVHYTLSSCLGLGRQPTLDALREGRGGLAPCHFGHIGFSTHVGEVEGIDNVRLPVPVAEFDCRNNRLALLTLEQDGFAEAVRDARARFGERRIGVFLGTSTGGILQTEMAYRRRDPATGALPPAFEYANAHSPYSLPAFVRRHFGLTGPALAISSACSSGAKGFVTARRMLECGLIDAAIVGGVDSLCHTTLHGFHALELVSPLPCRPYDVARNGISIGEGGAFALIERLPESGPLALAAARPNAILLRGIGESSDAHHMSTPHPDGMGARLAMAQALGDAGIAADRVDYINLHGTATRTNDAAEARAVHAVFGDTPCSSTKGATGHTLGAAGAVEAVISALALEHGLIPAGINTVSPDPALPVNYVLASRVQPLRNVMSNAFGFGGSNCCLLLGRADASGDGEADADAPERAECANRTDGVDQPCDGGDAGVRP